ncbi:protein TolR [Thiothrix nivea]|uniref:Tol-Pal system protein TolR n=1 Tax=Thiothrix nivea (strain ATCC 35100 / DSM 5205 / JP2) TaxID=870187 RepID=A0A656HDE6_THINJ|nr:protein TolR [Thiothrix nivea]EIJ34393.1 Cell division and transport-associated protein TolR [Thiothrix nivea DSM 5205]
MSTACRRKRRAMSQMNVVPYIDVMLVLLVIFMVTAPMMQTGVEVDAPDAQAEPLETDNQQEPLTISVDAGGHYFLDDGSEVPADGITSYVSSQLDEKAERPIYVRADSTVEYRYLMSAMIAVQKAGAKKIGLMADPAPPDRN